MLLLLLCLITSSMISIIRVIAVIVFFDCDSQTLPLFALMGGPNPHQSLWIGLAPNPFSHDARTRTRDLSLGVIAVIVIVIIIIIVRDTWALGSARAVDSSR